MKAPPPVVCDDQFREGTLGERISGTVPAKLLLVVARHRHLKWSALDPLEHVLMVICGISIAASHARCFSTFSTRSSITPFSGSNW